jgi:hypothetical protein
MEVQELKSASALSDKRSALLHPLVLILHPFILRGRKLKFPNLFCDCIAATAHAKRQQEAAEEAISTLQVPANAADLIG